VYNFVLKATFTLMDDGVFWRQAPQGLVASRLAPGRPGGAGGRARRATSSSPWTARRPSARRASRARSRGAAPGTAWSTRSCARSERRALEVTVLPLPAGNVSAFYYLSLAGFFSLVVGTVVLLRRPADRTSLHFYAVCVLFFLLYSTSYTG
jgi:hypothetical protein